MTMGTLKQQHDDYISRLRARGATILSYKAPCCGESIETNVPETGKTWDSLVTCPNCGANHMKVVSHDSVSATAV